MEGAILSGWIYFLLSLTLINTLRNGFNDDYNPIKLTAKIIHTTIKLTVKITAIYLSLLICAMAASTTCCPYLTEDQK